MLSIGIGSAAEYYLSQQQSYYLEAGEPPGRWFVLDGLLDIADGAPIDPQLYRSLHAGFGADGTALVQNAGDRGADRVGGIDLTFSAPKGVSMLWARAEPELRLAIEQAHDRAVRRALALLGQHAAFTRRGHGGATLEPTRFVAALFQHGEARPEIHDDGSIFADPDLHTHADILNVASRADGTWGALDARALLDWKMAAGAAYRVELCAALGALGFEVEPIDDNGLFDVVGIPAALKEFFSARRTAIEAALAADGLLSGETPEQASRAALATRRVKAPGPLNGDRHAHWQAKAAEQGFDLAGLAEKLRNTELSRHRPLLGLSSSTAAVLETLTQNEAVFGLTALQAEFAPHAIARRQDLDAIVSTIDELKASGGLLTLGDSERGMPRFTTPEMLGIERDVRDHAGRLDRRRFAAVDQNVAVAAARGAGLSEEQTAAVVAATDQRALAVVEGAAGAGKSTSLAVVARLYRAHGYRVIGAATAWRIAIQLADDCGIEARATADWLTRATAGNEFLDERTVLVVDEAGQLSARQMRAILAEAQRARAKVILTGDSRQLQPIGAGPGMGLVLEAAPSVRIDQIRRQRDGWMRTAVRDLMTGRAQEALAAFDEHGRLTWGDGRVATIDALVSRWAADRTPHRDGDAIIVARTHAEVRAVNDRVRAHLREMSEIGPDLVELQTVVGSRQIARIALAEGDRICFRKRLQPYGLVNGSEATVERVWQDQDERIALTVLVGDRRLDIDLDRIADRHGRLPIGHAYAATLYSAQGVTRDRAYVLGSLSFSREEAYVALSRSRASTEVFIDSLAIDRLEKKLLSGPEPSPLSQAERLERIARRWASPRGKISALGLARDRELRHEPEMAS